MFAIEYVQYWYVPCSKLHDDCLIVLSTDLWLMSRDLWLLEFNLCSSEYLVPYLDQLLLEQQLILLVSTGSMSVTGEETAGFMKMVS